MADFPELAALISFAELSSGRQQQVELSTCFNVLVRALGERPARRAGRLCSPGTRAAAAARGGVISSALPALGPRWALPARRP
jgi:hypothetical protein